MSVTHSIWLYRSPFLFQCTTTLALTYFWGLVVHITSNIVVMAIVVTAAVVFGLMAQQPPPPVTCSSTDIPPACSAGPSEGMLFWKRVCSFFSLSINNNADGVAYFKCYKYGHLQQNDNPYYPLQLFSLHIPLAHTLSFPIHGRNAVYYHSR